MAATASLKPLAPLKFGYAQARHLLNRAGFGGTLQVTSAPGEGTTIVFDAPL